MTMPLNFKPELTVDDTNLLLSSLSTFQGTLGEYVDDLEDS